MDKLIVEFYGNQFKFTFTEKTESYYVGYLEWDKENRKRFCEVEKLNEDEDNCWYLDTDGNRLTDNELFTKTPWTIIENGIQKKVVSRFQNRKTGEIRFATEPWFRIGDEYNRFKS